MKLSKAQQAVVDKMREGWIVDVVGGIEPLYRLTLPFKSRTTLNGNTFKSLLRNKVIEVYRFDGFTKSYRLTEQYKTANNENSNN